MARPPSMVEDLRRSARLTNSCHYEAGLNSIAAAHENHSNADEGGSNSGCRFGYCEPADCVHARGGNCEPF